MPVFAPVVCALDLAPESEPALMAAAELAARTGDPLHLVTVRPPDAPGDRDAVCAAVDRALGPGACEALAAHVDVAHGADAATAILAYADRVAAGSLVLGTHGRSGLRRLRLGSVAEAVLRGADVPVLVVPNASTRTPGPGHPVLVPVDVSETAPRALAAARDYAALFNAPVHLLAVIDTVAEAALTVADVLGPTRQAPTPDDLRAVAAADGLEPAGVHVAEGAPADEIVGLAAALDAGAVVMSTHGHRGPARVLLGSVTEATLRRLACPLLAIHSPSES